MKETVHFSKRQKAIVDMIIKQFKENLSKGLYEYDPVEAYQDLNKIIDLVEYELDIPGQIEVLQELSNMNLGIDIDFFKNDYDSETNCWRDGLRRCIPVNTDQNNPQQEERLQSRIVFGSVYIRADTSSMKRIKAMCDDGYQATLEFIDDCNYCVKCSRGKDFHKIYTFPTLHTGKRPQLILKYVLDHKDDDNPTISKETLNEDVLKNSTSMAPMIGSKESISSSVFDDVSMAVLSYFFDFEPRFVRFECYERNDLTGADIAVFEENCVSSSV